MFREIVCPTDFSDNAAVAVKHATTWAGRLGAALHLVHVRPPLSELGISRETFPAFDEYDATLERQSRERLDAIPVPPEVADTLPINRRTLVADSVADGVLAYAREVGADLILLGTRGLGPVARLLLGSAADQLLRLADRSVLTVPTHADTTPDLSHGILAPVDFSDAARSGASRAAQLARELGVRLILLHVVDPISHPAFFVSGQGSVFDAFPSLKARCRQKMGELLATIGADINTEIIVAEGREHQKIAEIGREHEASAIVMSSSGLGSTAGRLLGSVTGKVVRTAGRPVMVVR